MKRLVLIALCGCSQIFGLNSPSQTSVIDSALDSRGGSDDAPPAGCSSISDCPTSVCLPNGTCAADTDVAWLDPASTVSMPCTMAMPCYRLLDALATNRPYIRVHGTITNVSGISRAVTIFGEPGAAFSTGQMSVQSTVAIYDLTVQGCLTTNSSSVLSLTRVAVTSCSNGTAINVSGQLSLDRCIVSGNRGTGILITATATAPFSITNTFVVGNGNQMMNNVGGISIGSTVPAGSRLEFDTIVDNGAKTGGSVAAGGVFCNDALFAAKSNIIAHNNVQGDVNIATANTQGGCSFAGSLIEADDTNLNFVGAADYHLGAGSIAIDGATTPPIIDHDFDGDHRPQGNGYDVGADEYP